jgi:hypothetical protein
MQLTESFLRNIIEPGYVGFANGSRSNGSPNNDGGSAGGTLSIRVGGTLTNAGTITSNDKHGNPPDAVTTDDAGGGGGVGGFFVLISGGNMTNSGTISASGGNGAEAGPGDDDYGGGGGGLVHLIAPNASAVGGTVTLTGGLPTTLNPADAGSGAGGGGAGLTAGGSGGDDAFLAMAGSTCLIYRTQLSGPTALF